MVKEQHTDIICPAQWREADAGNDVSAAASGAAAAGCSSVAVSAAAVASDSAGLSPADCSSGMFIDLCRLLEDLDKPFKKPAYKLKALGRYVCQYELCADMFPLFRLILPQLDRDRLTYNMKESALARLYISALSLPATEAVKLKNFKDPAVLMGTEARVGDFSSVLYIVLQSRVDATSSLNLADVNSYLDQLHGASDT
eukprot:GHVQ01011531.1.p1 GENE.GHVQ01011531.1~~GHVQ01011531.1.p1  ORF type:complete len:199 (-),score=44.47 GHVQ01011531.1:136-732(-)